VSGGGTWKSISRGEASASTVCGIKTDDSLWCWGLNGGGQVGDGTSGTNRESPTPVSGGGAWESVSIGDGSSCGIKTDDTLWCWGSDHRGRLGNGATGSVSLPGPISGGGAWRSVSVRRTTACGIKTDNTLWCWGENDFGQRGDANTTTEQQVPLQVFPALNWSIVSVEGTSTCAITVQGVRYCWGDNGSGQLGSSTAPDPQGVPVQTASSDRWVAVSMNSDSACAIRIDGRLFCWGNNPNILAQNSGSFTADTPTQVHGGGTWKKIVVAGGYTAHACGIKSDDTLWCWGYNGTGQLGNGSTSTSYIPVQVGTATWSEVSGGGTFINGSYSTCGIQTNGSLWCWGSDDDGKLGNGATTGNQLSPVNISGAFTWKKVAVDVRSACAIRTDDTIWCWGLNDNGQLGIGSTTPGSSESPVQVTDPGPWREVAALSAGFMAIKTNGTLWAWGNAFLGNGFPWVSITDAPIAAAPGTWRKISQNGYNNHTMGIRTDNRLFAWGVASLGMGLGNSISSNVMTATEVVGGGEWIDVAVGGTISKNTCAINAENLLFCWGRVGRVLANPSITQSTTTAVLGDCAAPATPAGAILYNGAQNVMQYCDGYSYRAIGK